MLLAELNPEVISRDLKLQLNKLLDIHSIKANELSAKTQEVLNQTNDIQTDVSDRSNDFQNKLGKWQVDFEAQCNKNYNDTKARFDELGNLYEEKLRLKAPADYWKQLYENYTKSGRKWLGVAGGIVLCTITLLCIILFSDLPNVNSKAHFLSLDNLDRV